METRPHRNSFAIATILVASLGCLQPGIDPVFLTLLSAAHAVRPADHGWIVGATQTGMALGSLITWWAGSRLPQTAFLVAALGALLAGLATVQIDQTTALLAIRGGYGLMMGFLYTKAMSDAAAGRPNGAYGAVFLMQLVMSTLAALLLPLISDAAGPHLALVALCIVPFTAFALTAFTSPTRQAAAGKAALPPSRDERHPTSVAAWALAIATLLFICSTMMVWSFTGALAIAANIGDDVVGQAVAIGSISGALTAAAVMRERPLVPLPITGLLAGLSLLAPIAAARTGEASLFILSIILLNIGSTAIIIRGSGMATARSRDTLFRRLVTCTHSLGMIIGPIIGSIMTTTMGAGGLLIGAILTISAGCLALLLAEFRERGICWERLDIPHPGDRASLEIERACTERAA